MEFDADEPADAPARPALHPLCRRSLFVATVIALMGIGAALHSHFFPSDYVTVCSSTRTALLEHELLQAGKPLPVFVLKTGDGSGFVSNYNWEYIEQLMAAEHLLSDDRVLMLGGNIGSACIAADKLVSAGAVACVEPNPALHASLEFNRELNHAGFRVVKGVVGETPSEMATCNGVGVGTCGSTTPGRRRLASVPNLPLATLEREMFGGGHGHSHHAHAINGSSSTAAAGGPGFNFLLADCEGCLCYFFRDYPTIAHQLRGIILESDGSADPDCYTRDIFPKLAEAGLTRVAEPDGPEGVRTDSSPSSAVWIRQTGAAGAKSPRAQSTKHKPVAMRRRRN